MTFAYIRVSTSKQDTENQKYEILSYSHNNKLQVDNFIDETVSSKKDYTKRRLGELLNNIQAGDNLITTELSRLGRSLLEVMEILHQLMKKDVKVHITKMNLILGNDIQSKVMAMAFSLAAEIEREFISSRTKQALQKAKAQGKKLGRPQGSTSISKLDPHEEEIKILLEKNVSKLSICKIFDIAPATLYNFIKSRKITSISSRSDTLH